MLASANREYDQQQRLTALAVAEAERLATRGPLVVAQSVQTYQAAAVALSMATLDSLLVEQGIDTAQDAAATPGALLTGVQDLAGMLSAVQTAQAFSRLVATSVQDAHRTARTVDSVTRPAVTGHIRSLRPPSCSRCAILAGRYYPISQGFQRHPFCDCLMTPTNETAGQNLVTDPMDLFEKGQIRGLSKADAEAIRMGADMGQVVNVRRKQAGLTVGSTVMERAGRLTPAGCLHLASDRTQALALLRQHGYVT